MFLQFVCKERPPIIPGDDAGQNHSQRSEHLLSAEISREEVVMGGQGLDLITTPSNLFPFLRAMAINADQFCLLWILFYLDFHFVQYLWFCLLCRFLFKLWVTLKAECSDLSLSLCMCSLLKNSFYLYSLNYPSGSKHWLCIRIIWEVLKPYQSKEGENMCNIYHR